MPAADISEISVEFGNGIKREEYGPTKQAKVRIVAVCDKGQDAIASLNYISRLAQDKVRELLSIQGQPTEPAANEAAPAPAAEEKVERPTRGRKAASTPALAPVSSTDETSTSADPEPTAAITSQPTSDTAAAASSDDWEVEAPAQVITDQDLLTSLSAAAERVGSRDPINALLAEFLPVKAGVKVSPKEMDAAVRPRFLERLSGLKAAA